MLLRSAATAKASAAILWLVAARGASLQHECMAVSKGTEGSSRSSRLEHVTQ